MGRAKYIKRISVPNPKIPPYNMHECQDNCRKKDIIASESPPSVVEHDSRHLEWFSQFFLLNQSTRLSPKMWWTGQLDNLVRGASTHLRISRPSKKLILRGSVSSKWILISVSSKWVLILFLKSGFWSLRGGFWKSLLGFFFPCQLVSCLIFISKPWKYVSNSDVDFFFLHVGHLGSTQISLLFH